MNNFRVGQKVVCINGKWKARPSHYNEIAPVLNGIYTIRTIEPSTIDGVALRFDEIRNPINFYEEGRGETQFCGNAFRPLQTTDISIFEAMLKTKEIEVVDG